MDRRGRHDDPNPNGIEFKDVELRIPLEPVEATSPSCVRMGPIGVLDNGVFVYNAIDAAGGDAAAHETQDVCDGHPDGAEAYHYHNIASCLLDAAPPTGSTLIGYALDGYGIYVEHDSLGNLPTNSDLDACLGRTSSVMWNGVEQEIYHYSATLEFPYTAPPWGCAPHPSPAGELALAPQACRAHSIRTSVGCSRGTPVAPPAREA